MKTFSNNINNRGLSKQVVLVNPLKGDLILMVLLHNLCKTKSVINTVFLTTGEALHCWINRDNI